MVEIETDPILSKEEITKARLCPSYRLCVWIVLATGSTLSFTGVSSQVAVFTCRRLHSAADLGDEVRILQADNITAVRNETTNGTSNIWSKTEEGWVLAALTMGYYVIQLPASVIAAYVGSRNVSLVGTVVLTLTSLVSVPAMDWGPWACAVICFVKGAAAGALFPLMTSLASIWSGTLEISTVTSVIEGGFPLGHAISFFGSTAFCDGGDGWMNLFFAQAGLGAVFCLALLTLVQEQPENRPCMSQREHQLLSSSMASKGFTVGPQSNIPYRSILTSLHVYAIVVAQMGSEWLDCLFVTSLPIFLGTVHGMHEQRVALLTAIGFMLSIPVALIGARIADCLLERGCVSATRLRKIYDLLSKGLPTGCFLLLGYLDSSQVTWVAVIYVCSSALYGLIDSAWPANRYDIAPVYVGFLIGLGEAMTVWISSLTVVFVTNLTRHDTAEEWRIVMYLTTGVMSACVLFYSVFASGDRQPWAVPVENKVKE